MLTVIAWLSVLVLAAVTVAALFGPDDLNEANGVEPQVEPQAAGPLEDDGEELDDEDDEDFAEDDEELDDDEDFEDEDEEFAAPAAVPA